MKNILKRITVTLAVFAVAMVFSSPCFSAVVWPDYNNTTRHWGTVTQVFAAKIQPGSILWIAFILSVPDPSLGRSVYVRYDCDVQAHALGCDLVSVGDSVLVSGHEVDRLSCHWDGIDNYNVPNAIWRCPSSGCVLLTP